MLDIKLLEDEKIELVSNNSLIKYSKEVVNVSSVITNKRLLLLDFPKDLENFRVGRVIMNPIKKEVIFEADLLDIIDLEKNSEFDKYLLKNGSYFLIKDSEIKEYMLKVIGE